MTARYQLFARLEDSALAALRDDIARVGVLVPIEVDEGGEILDGHHRAEIAAELGIECPRVIRSFDSEEDKQEHVLKINLIRRHMDGLAWGRAFLQLLALRDVRRGQGARNDLTSDKLSEVAAELGVEERTARRRVEHVETVEQYPELGGPGWKQYHVLEIRERLEKLPEPERPKAAALITQREIQIDPRSAITMLGNLAEAPVEDRADIYVKAESNDARDRSDAVTARRMIARHELRGVKVGRQYRASVDDVERLADPIGVPALQQPFEPSTVPSGSITAPSGLSIAIFTKREWERKNAR